MRELRERESADLRRSLSLGVLRRVQLHCYSERLGGRHGIRCSRVYGKEM